MAMHRPYLFAKNTISGKPYKPQVLFLYYANPLFGNPSPNLFSKAFSEIPLIVSFSPYMDDSTQFADLILPDHTPMERWQDDPLFLNNGFPVFGIRQPVIGPLYQTQATGDVQDDSLLLGSPATERARVFAAVPRVEDDPRDATLRPRPDAQFDPVAGRLLSPGGWLAEHEV